MKITSLILLLIILFGCNKTPSANEQGSMDVITQDIEVQTEWEVNAYHKVGRAKLQDSFELKMCLDQKYKAYYAVNLQSADTTFFPRPDQEFKWMFVNGDSLNVRSLRDTITLHVDSKEYTIIKLSRDIVEMADDRISDYYLDTGRPIARISDDWPDYYTFASSADEEALIKALEDDISGFFPRGKRLLAPLKPE